MPEVGSGEPQVSSLSQLSIVEQIEYYFGDFNMMKDRYLKAEVQKNNGWVPIKTLLRFNRLAALTKDENVVLAAFKESPSELVEVDVENKSVRRNPSREIPEPGEDWRNLVSTRSVYIKGFPKETTTLDDIIKFMSTFGKIDNVFKRRYYDKALKEWKFKGSAYVAFPTREEAESFLSIGSVKFAGNELIRKWQTDYTEEKKNERLEIKMKAKEAKEKLLKDQAHAELKSDQKLPTGALIQLHGLKDGLSFAALKKKLTEDFKWNVGFVDYSAGEPNAYVRLQEENSAKDALGKLTDNSFEIDGVTIKAELIEGEKEVELLQKMEADKNSRVLQNFMRQKNKGGRKNKGFRQRGRRGNDDNNDEVDASNKKGNGKKSDDTSKKADEAPAQTSSGNGSGSPTLKRKQEDNPDGDKATKKTKSDD